jgi:hypothetical protein
MKAINVIKEEHHGEQVWVNPDVEKLRKKECLCLNCRDMNVCNYAQVFYKACVEGNIAMIITRCKSFKMIGE